MTRFLRPELDDPAATYVPGAQPGLGEKIIKLNTNEFPEPPEPEVLDAAVAALARIHKYPSPMGEPARSAAARAWNRKVDEILVVNGSDEALRMIFQAFVAPGDRVAFSPPTYSYYEILVRQFRATPVAVPRTAPEVLPVDELAAAETKVVFVCSPDAPLGTLHDEAAIRRIAANPNRLVILDEAYLPFATRVPRVDDLPNVIRLRTLSKGDALAGMRIGFALAGPDLIADLCRVKESYNVDGVAAAVGAAALANPKRESRIARVRERRDALAKELAARGFFVYPSEANYLFARCDKTGRRAAKLLTGLHERGVLVRHFPDPRLPDGLRITVGTRGEIDRLLEALDAELNGD